MRSAHHVIDFLRLTRFDTTLLVFLSVFLPLFAKTKDAGDSLGKAVPLLFIGFCTFVANDLDDVERDRINHPERPLPSGQVKETLAAILYFICLALALFTTRYYITERIAFWYYGLLTLVISYGYVVEHLPGLKSLYVAATSSVPIMIVVMFCSTEKHLYLVSVSTFFFVLGRELCMDLLDREGDPESFMRKFSPKSLSLGAFFVQGIGVLLLLTQAKTFQSILVLIAMVFLLSLSILCWYRNASPRRAIRIMKAQLFLGLYFLI